MGITLATRHPTFINGFIRSLVSDLSSWLATNKNQRPVWPILPRAMGKKNMGSCLYPKVIVQHDTDRNRTRLIPFLRGGRVTLVRNDSGGI